MDIVVTPFHDWKKSEAEGFRTRDVHIINALAGNTKVGKILVVNRPSTFLEDLYKRSFTGIKGKLITQRNGFSLYKISEKIYVVNYRSNDILGQVIKKHKWFFEKYSSAHYVKFIDKSLASLGVHKPLLLTQNVFASGLASRLTASSKIFDAWDNFLKFPSYKSIRKDIYRGYQSLAESSNTWLTNSRENQNFYQNEFGKDRVKLLKNGVNTNFIPNHLILPDDLKRIPRPIIGFGGKLSYLINTNLINTITKDHPDKSFVFVGQILDKEVYNQIEKRPNVHFLGDKHYSIYPQYVSGFDICVIPYNIKEKQHGGDSIKAYEYLMTGKKVVGTRGNGLEDLGEYIYLADSNKEFTEHLRDFENKKPAFDINKHSWQSKAEEILQLFEDAETI
ncbi:glycosyltransferase family protein [Robertkochia flava]|uniref:glycosyltransferase n=1 Tax=Robertkochia flava TaxID=3447986 RepID=UPI001CCA4F9E|nr:glycosyltransferase [Robertkochia marina]